jgi:peroxiredoxin
VLAVVVDPVATNAEVAADLGLSYRILADPMLAVIDAYGLRHDDGHGGTDIARPATFLIDAGGVVRWRSLTPNYRLRPKPDEILTEIGRISGEG